jgi:hypothetical protein
VRSLCFIAALIVFCAVPAAAQDDPFDGTWKLSVEKSKLSRPVRSATMRIRVAIDDVDIPLSNERMELDRVYADGTREAINYAARYSGRDWEIKNTITGESLGEEANLKMIDANTREYVRLKNRKPLATSRRVLSADKKTLTVTTTTQGATVPDVEIWERQ